MRGDNVYSWIPGAGCGVFLRQAPRGFKELLPGADIGEYLLPWILRTVLIPKA
jgi:hypothetical protein